MQKNMKKIIRVGLLIVALTLITPAFTAQTYAKSKKKTYTVSPKTIGKYVKNYKKYNSKTKAFYGMNYYLSKLEKKGGGKLVLKKGTYNLTNTVYIPSNVTIVLKDGVVIKKTFSTGYASLKPSGSLFMFCAQSKSNKKNAMKKYKGCKNIKIVGEGNATIDFNYGDGPALVMSHNKNVTITGIKFKNMKKGHFIEVNGSNNVTITNNTFSDSYNSTKDAYYNKEAINIDADDVTTQGLNAVWSKADKTPCKNVRIENNVFDNVTRGIGTHKYSQKNGENVYHTGLVIRNNTFKNIYDNGIFALNWQNAVIENNRFNKIGLKNKRTYSSASHAISGGGIDGITIIGNTFENIKRSAVHFCVQQNVGPGSQYSKTKVRISKEQFEAMADNEVINCGYDDNPNFSGYDIIYFNNDSNRSKNNLVGMNLKTKETIYN